MCCIYLYGFIGLRCFNSVQCFWVAAGADDVGLLVVRQWEAVDTVDRVSCGVEAVVKGCAVDKRCEVKVCAKVSEVVDDFDDGMGVIPYMCSKFVFSSFARCKEQALARRDAGSHGA